MTDTAPEAPAPDPNAVNITINGRPHVARKGQLLIDAAKDAADRGVVNPPGMLRPQYLIAYQDNPVVPSSPEFIREDVPSR